MSVETVDIAQLSPRPWRTIWFSPRLTMRQLIASESRPSWTLVVGLAALHGALSTLGGLAAKGQLSLGMAVMPTLIGVMQVFFGVLVGPFLLAFSGGWFGGQAEPDDIRQSLAWSYAPYAVTAVVWIPILLVMGDPMKPESVDTPSAWMILKALLLVVASLVYFSALAWNVVLQVITLAEVQKFSILRSFASIVIWLVPMVLLSLLR